MCFIKKVQLKKKKRKVHFMVVTMPEDFPCPLIQYKAVIYIYI